jgi:hypothetical protein
MKMTAPIVSKAFETTLLWTRDEYDIWNLNFAWHPYTIHAWITKRPVYCDRGHWQLNIIFAHEDGIPVLDHQDGFPRYFMDFEVAKEECEKFLNWRILKIP